MWHEIGAIAKTYIGLLGAAIAAAVGILTRQIYHPDGFQLRRALRDIPFAMLTAIIAGATGEYFGLPEIVIWGIAGSIGYMSPQFLSDFLGMLKNKARKKIGGEDAGGA